jgi:hypothetical protein
MEQMAVWVLLAAAFLVRILYALHYRVDSDEPQHLHVAWSWANGLLPYRDFFDNHVPLFHVLAAPLVLVLGERADLLIWMRLAMLPLFAAALGCVYWIGRSLWSPRVGLWAAVWAGLLRPVFVDSVEYRADDLWMVLWLLTIALLVRPRVTGLRVWLAGLALGAAAGASIKTGPLAACLVGAAALTLLLTWAIYPWRRQARRVLRLVLLYLAGLAVIPLLILLYFVARGAFGAFWYAMVEYNVDSGARDFPGHWYLLALPVVIGVPLAWGVLRLPSPAAVTVRRLFFVLLTGLSLASLPFWPVLAPQDYLVVYPLLPVLLAAGIDQALSALGRRTTQRRRVLSPAAGLVMVGLAVGAVEFAILLARAPWRSQTSRPIGMWQDVLRLTDPGQRVMDLKGELIFRRRAYYYIFDTMSERRFQRGLLRDDVPERLIATRTCVASMGRLRLPPRAEAFLDDNYVSVGTLRVAGKQLPPAADAAGSIAFEVWIAARYVIVGAQGPARGTLDGRTCDGPRQLEAGRHEYRPAADESGLTLVWAQAIERGFSPIAIRPQEASQ